ncbi:MAG: nucleotidyltransferase domain-containing protein [Planctomycetes bacterium]|nr:nucleotidyltransferase domain-containing protein [Planctomycetota bacterium]
MVRPLRARDKHYAAYPLNTTFGSPSHIAILRALKDSALGSTGREIARRSGVTRPAVMNGLAILESTGVVRRQFAGRTHVFHLNREHWLIRKGLLPLFEAEKDFRERARLHLVRAVHRHALAGVIFGSTAREEETSASDFDVCILVEKKKDKEIVRRRLDDASESLKKELGLTLAPLLFTRAEFQRQHRKGESFFVNIVLEGKRFHGPELKEIVRDSAD